MAEVNWHTFFFLVAALAACGFAIAVVISGNIVRMAFYLVMSLGAVSGLFFLAGADLIGALQLMIYVGGTLVLLVFGVMLTSGGPFARMKTPRWQWALSIVLAGWLLAILLKTATSVDDWGSASVSRSHVPPEAAPTARAIGLALVGVRVDRLAQQNQDTQAGMAGYLLPFEIVSVHLVVVLVGAAYLARTKRRKQPAQFPQKSSTQSL